MLCVVSFIKNGADVSCEKYAIEAGGRAYMQIIMQEILASNQKGFTESHRLSVE